MVDKIVNAINEILGGEGDTGTTPPAEQPKDQPASGFVPTDSQSEQPQAGDKARNLQQLVADAKKQVGENPQ